MQKKVGEMQFSILKIMVYTAYWAVAAFLYSLGEFGISFVPAWLLLQLFYLPVHFHQADQCPELMKIRYHIPFWLFACIPLGPGFLYEYGVWQLPFSAVLSVLLAPAIVGFAQLIKLADKDRPHLWMRTVQLYSIWSAILMNVLSARLGTFSMYV
ncbi:hypothetical protein OAG68_00440 [bacterium]|nr:hypothetical protein [bacterium]